MNKSGTKTVYFLGIGGIGMSALARYYHSQGATVAGYDRTRTPLTEQLENEGMAIHYEDQPELLPALIDCVVYTPAVPQDLREWEALRQRHIPTMKRAEALGAISKEHFTIAVAGTHGKTTTTAMVAHILNQCGVDMTAFIGGIANNFGSNLHLGTTDKALLVVEADEFDRSFLHLNPDISIINSIDADHLDIYGDRQHLVESFNAFARLTKRHVIVREGLNINVDNKISFGFGDDCDYRVDDLGLQLPIPGRHNLLNATAAFIAASKIGIPSTDIIEALSTFKGVKRRFDIRIRTEQHVYIDDYAHHPEEIKSCLSAIRTSFPSKRVTVVFQPHLFTRTRDFMEDFAKSLAMADNLILLDIYPAREKPLEGITSQALLDKVDLTDKALCRKEDLLPTLERLRPELLVTMGAGDIDRFVEPIENMMSQW